MFQAQQMQARGDAQEFFSKLFTGFHQWNVSLLEGWLYIATPLRGIGLVGACCLLWLARWPALVCARQAWRAH